MKLEDNPLLILPEDYKGKIKRFYDVSGEDRMRVYAAKLKREHNIEIRTLNFDKEKGLTNVSTSPSIGLDLDINGTRFQAHNIYDLESKEAEQLVKIILKYIEILESL